MFLRWALGEQDLQTQQGLKHKQQVTFKSHINIISYAPLLLVILHLQKKKTISHESKLSWLSISRPQNCSQA